MRTNGTVGVIPVQTMTRILVVMVVLLISAQKKMRLKLHIDILQGIITNTSGLGSRKRSLESPVFDKPDKYRCTGSHSKRRHGSLQAPVLYYPNKG